MLSRLEVFYKNLKIPKNAYLLPKILHKREAMVRASESLCVLKLSEKSKNFGNKTVNINFSKITLNP